MVLTFNLGDEAQVGNYSNAKSIEQKKCCQFHKIWNIIIIALAVSCQFELDSTSGDVIIEVHAVFFELEIA